MRRVGKSNLFYLHVGINRMFLNHRILGVFSLFSTSWVCVKSSNTGIPNTLPLSPNRPIPSSGSDCSIPGSIKRARKMVEDEKCDVDADVGRVVHTL